MRRRSNEIPQARAHSSGQARLCIQGKTFWLGRFGSPEARQKEDQIVAAWLANGRRLPDGIAATSAAPAPAAATPPAADAVDLAHARPAPEPYAFAPIGHLTLGQLCQRWLAWVETERCRPGTDTSLVFGARQAIRALRRHWKMRADEFGPRSLAEVRLALANEPSNKPGRKRADGTTAPPRYRSRKTVADVVGRVRQMFRWGVSRELVRPEILVALSTLEPLMPGQTNARETGKKKPVPEADFAAVLPHVPTVVADLLRVARLTASRPGELCRMTAAEIDRSAGTTWVYRPTAHKNAWRGHDREITIGPRAQAILAPYILKTDPEKPLFSPKLAFIEQKKRPGPNIGDAYNPDAIRRAVERACRDHGITLWTPSRLRHTRLNEIRDAYGPDHVQAVASHKHISMADVYTSAARRKAEEVAIASG